VSGWLLTRTASCAAVLTVLLVVCGHGTGTPAGHVLNGEYLVHGVYPHPPAVLPSTGSPCSASDVGYSDIHPGTPVVVRNGGGDVVGRTTLGSGQLRVSGNFRSDCVYRFSARVRDEASYEIEVATRGTVDFTRADLEHSHWKPALTIGNYTEGI
jgi:hypothetical protein